MVVMRIFLASLLCLITMSVSIFAYATVKAEEGLEIRRIVQFHPRQAAADAHLLLQHANSKNDRKMQLKALRILAGSHSLLGNMFVVGEDLARGKALAIELRDRQARVEFLIAEADELQLQEQFSKADRRFSEARALALQSKLPLAIAESDAAIVGAALDRGSAKNVVLHATKAYELFENEGDLRGMARMLAALGMHSTDPARMIEYFERADDLLDPAVFRWDAMLLHYQLGVAFFQGKDYGKAMSVFQKALKEASDLGIPVYVAYMEYYLGRIDVAERRFVRAIDHLERAVPAFTQNNDFASVFEAQRFRADALSALGRNPESADALAKAQATAETIHALEAIGKRLPRISRLQSPSQRNVLAVGERRTGMSRFDHVGSSTIEERFDAKLRETENALLREQQKRTELERVTLVLALAGSVCILFLALFLLVRQIRQKRRFANLALRDELTGLRNRRSILEFGRIQLGISATLDARLFVAILDLDHFKSVNDQYGHDVGDAVLIGFANACQQHLRSNHVFGRFGGEEFLLIMPNTREDQVFDVFERLREVVSEVQANGLPATHRITFSMGSAEACAETSSIEALIKRADAALYRAKEKGRDRCEVHLGTLQATYDANVLRARPRGHAPLSNEPLSRPKNATGEQIAEGVRLIRAK